MDKSRVRIHVIFCILLILVGSIAIIALHWVNRNRLREVLIERESGNVQTLTESLNNFYEPLAKNIEFLASRPSVRDVLRKRESADSLAEDFSLISSAVQGYDQIRLLDLAGQEILRVNRAGNQATIVDKEGLQDKSDRGYFAAARELGPNEIYIGPIDLNQERGRIEFPYKEVIRCAKQVLGDNQQSLGFVITNYTGNQFLPRQDVPITGSHQVLLTEEGSFIQGPSAYPKYANLVQSEPPCRFADFYPLAWKTIRERPNLQRIETTAGIFICQSIRPHSTAKVIGEPMYLISIIPESFINATSRSSWWTTLALPMIGWWLVTGMLSIAIAKRDEHRMLAQQQTLIATHLSEQAEELRKSNEELEQFAFIASHDLQEPLRKICTFADLLIREEKATLSPDGIYYIEIMANASARMRALIEALLDYSRIESRQRDLEPVDSEVAFREAIDNLSQTVNESNAVIRSPHSLPVVLGEKAQLTRLFQNLIGNAIKYCEQQPEIEVRAKRDGSFVLFSIQDNGIGIKDEYSETIFQVFKRLHTYSEYSGTGIGLPICRRIVERNGGTIWVESGANGGSVFHFTIPAA